MLLKLVPEKKAKIKKRLNKINLLAYLEEIKKKHKINFFFVGGFVRDCFLNRTTNDIDIITTQARKLVLYLSKYYRTNFIVLDEQLDIFRIILSKYDITIDIAQIRGNHLKRDILKRDFTINALVLYYKMDSFYILDYVGGLEHLQDRKIVLVSHNSLTLDPLRIMRVFRFAANLDFIMDMNIKNEIEKSINSIKYIASERLFYELSLYILSNNILKTFDIFVDTKLFLYFFDSTSYSVFYNVKIKEIISFLQEQKDIEGFSLSVIKLKDTHFLSPYHFLILFVLFAIIYKNIFDLLLHKLNISRYIKSNLKVIATNYNKMKSIENYDELEDLFLDLLVKKGDIAIILLFYIVIETKIYKKKNSNIEKLFYNLRTRFYINYKKNRLMDGNYLINKGIEPSPVFSEILSEVEKAKIKGIIRDLHDVDILLKNKFSV